MREHPSHSPPARDLLGKFLRFVSVGGLCASLNLLIIWFFTSRIGWNYSIGVIVSFFFVNWIGLTLNKQFTFKKRSRPKYGEARRYYFIMSVTLILNLAMMHAMVDLLGVEYLLSSIVITLIFTVSNFLAHRVWTFAS